MQSTRFNTFEKQFCSLIFRTEVELIDEHFAEKGYTTQLLKRYAHAFNELCRRFPYIERFEHIAKDKHNASDASEKKDRFIQAQSGTANTAGTCRLSKCFDEQKFGQWYVSRLQNLAEQQNSLQTQHSGSASATDKAVLASLLPKKDKKNGRIPLADESGGAPIQLGEELDGDWSLLPIKPSAGNPGFS